MVRIRSYLLTAEISGGFWKRLPVRVESTLFSFFSLSMLPCSLTMPMYSLPAVCWLLASRVALNNSSLTSRDTRSDSLWLWDRGCRSGRFFRLSRFSWPRRPLHGSWDLKACRGWSRRTWGTTWVRAWGGWSLQGWECSGWRGHSFCGSFWAAAASPPTWSPARPAKTGLRTPVAPLPPRPAFPSRPVSSCFCPWPWQVLLMI